MRGEGGEAEPGMRQVTWPPARTAKPQMNMRIIPFSYHKERPSSEISPAFVVRAPAWKGKAYARVR